MAPGLGRYREKATTLSRGGEGLSYDTGLRDVILHGSDHCPGDWLDDPVDGDRAKSDAIGEVDHSRLEHDVGRPVACTRPAASSTT